MARDPTRFSRVSIGWASSSESIADVDASDTGPVWSSTGPIAIGQGAAVELVSSTTHDVDFGSIPAHDSSTVTVGVTGAARGDAFIVTPDSEWSGTDYDLSLLAHSGDTTGEVTLAAANSTTTAHNPASTVFRLTRIAFSDYL